MLADAAACELCQPTDSVAPLPVALTPDLFALCYGIAAASTVRHYALSVYEHMLKKVWNNLADSDKRAFKTEIVQVCWSCCCIHS